MANMSLEKIKMPEQKPDVRNKNFEEVALAIQRKWQLKKRRDA